ncbi:VC0807 family protein [Azohydromonas sediminis]|uniref:VC0807 family protein n=1 Tax=Azohydromonas sediminis TaxID=2259674 RepID=UPI001F3A2B45|nr:VC0807 family protein [Azohydromonas sediminis]
MTSPPTPASTPSSPGTPRRRDNGNPLLEVVIAIVVPAVILMKFSGDQHLGTTTALLVALAFPLGWGLYGLVRQHKLSFIAVLGVVSTLLTGGIGLLKLDPQWLAVKEAAVPGLIGLAVLLSARTRWPLIRMLVYNPQVLDVEKVDAHLAARGNVDAFEARLRNGTLLLAGTFFFSAAMNYLLARWIVTSPAGTEAFNEELGRLTLMSYPMIALPSMAMTLGVVYYLAHGVKQLTGLTLMEMLHHHHDDARGQ